VDASLSASPSPRRHAVMPARSCASCNPLT
jgi:hypothetical protein